MTSLHSLRRHSLPIALTSRREGGPKDVRHASAALLWVDRPFAVTAAHALEDFLRRMQSDRTAGLWLGGLRLDDPASRVLCCSREHDLATLRVAPEELGELGDETTFHNPVSWPPRPVEVGEDILVLGFPRDQWPAQTQYTFRVESSGGGRFSAVLQHSDMPGLSQGLCGAPAFRVDEPWEFAGIVTESLFHNGVVNCQHARHVDTCGNVPGGSTPLH